MRLDEIFKPFCVLVGYRKREGRTYWQSSLGPGDVYLEAASVTDNKVGPFAPLSKRIAKPLGEALISSSEIRIGGVVPRQLIYVSFNILHTNLMWWTPPGPQLLLYDRGLNIPSGEFDMPWMVWYLKGRNLYIYAALEQPGLLTELYKAPFHNTNKEGLVCMGTGYEALSRRFVSFENSIHVVERAFYDTVFTHAQDSRIIHGNLNEFHRLQIEEARPMDSTLLVRRKETIQSILKLDTDVQQEEPGLPQETE